ncbi:hypothetical protein L292_0585 [Acinetobacter junii CIP 107470 = MTCC 11364]|uniref:Uncharacterized protein n=1 Tax=Acinetobacter junii CIP 107470 = MTCC 11364 TaxID=1217666 RepID=S7WM63_ACIJU|nr:hypothetical protein [Acinetobacter junii]EPR82947.1 hypothetical protein L292_0585 [Acinetobacter junii CIP 107470 = MTCC 11364]
MKNQQKWVEKLTQYLDQHIIIATQYGYMMMNQHIAEYSRE